MFNCCKCYGQVALCSDMTFSFLISGFFFFPQKNWKAVTSKQVRVWYPQKFSLRNLCLKSEQSWIWRSSKFGRWFSCDLTGHAAYGRDTLTQQKVVDAFGTDILTEDGHINRKALGAKVFTDKVEFYSSIIQSIVKLYPKNPNTFFCDMNSSSRCIFYDHLLF